MIFFFRCRRVRALRCAQWCAWLRRMPARPIRSCISHLRTAPSFRCVRVVVGGNTLGMSISPFVSLCHAVTHKHCLPPSLHPSIFPLYCHSIFKYVYMQDTYSHARTHTHTHTHTHHQTNTLGLGRWCQRKHPSSISRHLTSRCPS